MADPAAIEFRVPASTANLGPGFGVLGLALDLAATVRVAARDGEGIVIERPEQQGQPTLDLRHDSVLRGVQAAVGRWGVKLPAGLHIEMRGDVPRGCGLGTNSADFAAGLRAALQFAKKKMPIDEGLNLLTALGGDPAHSAATLAGGLVVAAQLHSGGEQRRFRLLSHPIDPGWHLAIVAPHQQFGTADVHRVVPASLPHAVTQRTAGRLAGVLQALASGDEDLLGDCLVDEVHVPYRRRMVQGIDAAMAAARDAGAAGVTISGHGPALLALGRDEATVGAAGDAMAASFAAAGSPATVLRCRPSPAGALSP